MIRKRGNSYEVRAYNPASKKNEYVGSRTSRSDARELERDSEVAFARSKTTRSTVSEFAERWLELYPPREASTYRDYSNCIKRVVRDLGHRPLGSITRMEARAYVVAHPSRLGTLRKFYNNAIDSGLAHDNPFARLGITQSRGRRDLKVLSETELGLLEQSARDSLGASYGSHFAACIRFAASTCVRPGELFALDWSGLDLSRGRGRIDWQQRRDGRARPKKESQRDIVVPPAAVAVLRTMPRFDSEWVFGSITGRRLTANSHEYVWNKVRSAFGRPGMDFYELRHYGATALLELGVSAEDVAIQMGHKDGGELVRTRYGHPSHEASLDRIQQAFGGNDGGEEAAA